VAYAIAHSPLVKTAFFASDPNLGRILAAVGYAGVKLDTERMDLYIDDVLVAKNGGRFSSARTVNSGLRIRATPLLVAVGGVPAAVLRHQQRVDIKVHLFGVQLHPGIANRGEDAAEVRVGKAKNAVFTSGECAMGVRHLAALGLARAALDLHRHELGRASPSRMMACASFCDTSSPPAPALRDPSPTQRRPLSVAMTMNESLVRYRRPR